MKDIIFDLYQKKNTVFTFNEISLWFPKIKKQSLKDKLKYAVKKQKILRLRKGIYAKNQYNIFELANKIYKPSYISLETVLKENGIIFQETGSITVVSYISRKITIDKNIFLFRKIKDEILLNKKGILSKDNYFIAEKERAFLDSVFLYKDFYFDNLIPLDWEKIFDILKIYQSKALEKRVNDYYKIFKKEYA